MLMEMSMMVIGWTIKQMDMEFISMPVVHDMKGTGKMINKKDKGMKFGQRDQNIKANIWRVKNMEKEF